jgi:hypothetical protein
MCTFKAYCQIVSFNKQPAQETLINYFITLITPDIK